MSTLKFAERVSGVELGIVRSSKDGKDLKEMMEQVPKMIKAQFMESEISLSKASISLCLSVLPGV